MNMRNPPPLYELAKQSLLKNETISCTAVPDLPPIIFQDLFMDAFMGDHNEAIKMMVQAWPFSCLPLKTLMDFRRQKTPPTQFDETTEEQRSLRTLKAILEGLGMQLSQKSLHIPTLSGLGAERSCSSRFKSRSKLQELDWRDGHSDFGIGGPRAMNAVYLADAKSEDTGKPELREEKPTLRIFAHLCFELSSSSATRDKLQNCLLKWIRKRKASVHLCAEQVTIRCHAIFTVLKLLRAVQPDSIQKLDVLSAWGHKGTKAFVLLLKKMKNLHTFHFSCLNLPDVLLSSRENKKCSRLYTFDFRQLRGLRDLHIDEVYFLHGTLHKTLRSETPLDTLSLSSSPLTESDLKHLSQCTSTSKLKSLNLRRFSMKSFNPEILQVLINKLAGTLETLVLEHCDLTDIQMSAIMVALSRCSRLKSFSCYGNHFSLGILQALLHVSAGLSQLTLGLYPAPLESYEFNIPTRYIDPERFVRVCTELAGVFENIRPSLAVHICIHSCYFCFQCKFCRLEPNGNWEVTEVCRY